MAVPTRVWSRKSQAVDGTPGRTLKESKEPKISTCEEFLSAQSPDAYYDRMGPTVEIPGTAMNFIKD